MRLGLLGITIVLFLGSCATEGRVYDREASDNFRIGFTSAEDAIAALGSPDLDIVRPGDQVRILRWQYSRLRGLSVTQHVLSANFDRTGKLVYLHNPVAGQVIDPF